MQEGQPAPSSYDMRAMNVQARMHAQSPVYWDHNGEPVYENLYEFWPGNPGLGLTIQPFVDSAYSSPVLKPTTFKNSAKSTGKSRAHHAPPPFNLEKPISGKKHDAGLGNSSRKVKRKNIDTQVSSARVNAAPIMEVRDGQAVPHSATDQGEKASSKDSGPVKRSQSVG
jgi:hypothetical protein